MQIATNRNGGADDDYIHPGDRYRLMPSDEES
jgi:hypothetical protein